MSEEAPRQLPCSPQAEEALLSCIILDGAESLVTAINKNLTAQCFFQPNNRIIYERLLAMLASSKPIDAATLWQELYSHKEVEIVGGLNHFQIITGLQQTTLQVSYWIDKLKELQALRTIIRESTSLSERAYSYAGGGISDLIGRPLERLLNVLNDGGEDEDLTWPQLVAKAHKCAEDIISHQGRPADRIIPYPFPEMNRIFGEPERGDLVIIAGNSSTGKSSLGRQIACHASTHGKKRLS